MRRHILLLLLVCTLVYSIVEVQADERLSQKVTYRGGYKRLHDHTDELSKITGVKIRSGKNVADWQVRDIPLFVSVKDMTLGALLNTVAQATHVQLFVSNHDDEKPTYSLYRSKKDEQALLSSRDKLVEANLATAMWAWDALTALAKLQEAPANLPTTKLDGVDIDPQLTLITAKALASLGSEARDKAFAGEQLSYKLSSLPQSSPLWDLYNYTVRTGKTTFPGNTPREPAEGDLEQAAIFVKIIRTDRSVPDGGFVLLVHGVPVKTQSNGREYNDTDDWSVHPGTLAKALTSVKDLNLPPPPETDSLKLSQETDVPAAGMKPLKTADDWKLPLLQEKVKLKLSEWPAREEVLLDLSEVGDWNIVCEDFISHRYHRGSSSFFNSSPTAASVLKMVDRDNQSNWFIDEKKKLLIGWADGWRKHHQNLVPESILKNIVAKQKAQGAELDDLVPLTWLNDGQIGEWVAPTPQLRDCQITVSYQAFWQLYDCLKPKDKKLARSEKGFPLAMLDTLWLRDFISGVRASEEKDMVMLRAPEDDRFRQRDIQAFSDPELLSTLVMRVVKQPLDHWRVRELKPYAKSKTYTPEPNGVKKHTYRIELTGGKENDPFHVTAKWLDPPFPVFDPKREAELRKPSGKAPGKGH